MTEAERKEYAKHLILDHAKDVEFLTVFEALEYEWSKHEGADLSENANAVADLISSATVTVTFE